MTDQSDELRASRTRRIKDLLASNAANDFDQVLKNLHELRDLVHDHIAAELAPSLNQYLAKMPHDTLQEKQQLVREANQIMRSVGTCVRCPKTNEAARLKTDFSPDLPEGRFQIALINHDGGSKRTVSSVHLFPLNLMKHHERREPLAEYWADKAATKKGHSKDRQ